MRKTAGRRCNCFAPREIIILTAMKQTITYLRATGRRLMGFIKKLLGKAAHQGTLKIGVTIGFPLCFRSLLATMRDLGARPTTTTRKSARPADLRAAPLRGGLLSVLPETTSQFTAVNSDREFTGVNSWSS